MSTLSTPAKSGFWLCVVLGLSDLPGFLISSPDDVPGPPDPIMVLDTVLGVITIAAAVVFLLRRARPALRVMAAARILSAITALPAFFVSGVPVLFVVWAAVLVVLTVVAVVLLMRATRPSRAAAGAATVAG